MARTRRLNIEITDSRKGTGFRDAERDVDSFGKKLTSGSQSWVKSLASFAKVAAVGLGIAGAAAVSLGLDMVHAAEESAQVGRQTTAVIQSMGAASWTTADAVAGLAEKLSLKSGVDDEVIQSGENVLLTFANVRDEIGRGNDIFTQATGLALDMSVALGQDMQQSVIQLGKALNDPIAGVSALRRVGVQLTDQQTESIEKFVEQGDILSAQKVILGELSNQFGGSAEAQATASAKMSVAWGNLQEKLGEKLLPVFESVSSWITASLIPAMEDLSAWIEKEVVPRLEDMGGWLGEHVVPAVQTLAEWITGTLVPALADFAHWMTEHQRVLAAVAIGIAAVLVPAFVAWSISAGAAAIATLAAMAPLILIGIAVGALAYLIITHWDTIKRWTITAFNAVKDAIAAAFNWVKENWPLLLGIITGPIGWAVILITQHWDTIKSGFTAVKDWIGNRITDIVSFFTGMPGRLAAAAGDLFGFIGSSFRGAINAVIGVWNGLAFPSKTFSIPKVHIPGTNTDIGGGSFTVGGWNLPDIPYLAEGGIVRRPTLAMIGEAGPEAVVPLGRGIGGTTINVYVQGSVLSERDLIGAINRATSKGIKIDARALA